MNRIARMWKAVVLAGAALVGTPGPSAAEVPHITQGYTVLCLARVEQQFRYDLEYERNPVYLMATRILYLESQRQCLALTF